MRPRTPLKQSLNILQINLRSLRSVSLQLKPLLPGSIKIGSYLSNLTTLSNSLSKMPGSTKIEKVVQTEVERFANLALQMNNAETLLADEERLRSHVRVPSGYLTKLNSAASEYEQAVAIVLATLEPDSNQRVVYTTKLSDQLALVDHLTN